MLLVSIMGSFVVRTAISACGQGLCHKRHVHLRNVVIAYTEASHVAENADDLPLHLRLLGLGTRHEPLGHNALREGLDVWETTPDEVLIHDGTAPRSPYLPH